MLVYLDTAHFSYLADRADAGEVRAFFRAWDHAGCELAFSSPHLKEFAQLEDPASRERRLGSLERFEKIHFSPEVSTTLIVEEIKHQYDALKHGKGAEPRVLRNRLFPRSGMGEIRELFPLVREITAELRANAESYAALENAVRKRSPLLDEIHTIVRGKPFPEDLPPEVTKLTRDDIEAARAKVQDPALAPLQAIYGRVKRKRGRTPPPDQFYRWAPEFSFLKLLEEPGIARRRFPAEDQPHVARFFSVAIDELRIERSESALLSTPWSILTNEMDPYQCPGWNLWMAILRGLRSAPKPAEPSDPVDWEHAAHFPYVDLAFADRRVRGHLQDQSKRPAFRLTPAAVSHIRWAPPNADAVIREIEAHAGSTSADAG